jgi:hypothetical protein
MAVPRNRLNEIAFLHLLLPDKRTRIKLLLLPFALMQKLPPKDQGCINPLLKIDVSAGSKPNSLRSDSGLLLIGRANDFLNAGFIRPVCKT